MRKRKPVAPVLRIPHDLQVKAQAVAEHECRTTGRPVTWQDIARRWMEQASK